MSDLLRLGTRASIGGASQVAIDLDLESETAVGLRIDEATGSTVASVQIRSNAGTSVFDIFSTAVTEDMIDVVTSVTTANVLDLGVATLTTGKAIDISDLDALTTGGAIVIASNSASTGTRSLVSITNDNTLATGATCLEIVQDALLEAMSINMGTLDKGFINFIADADADATSAISTHGTTGTVSDFIQIGLNGASAWIAVSTADPTS